jgi:uncharacterized membrane protein YfcA
MFDIFNALTPTTWALIALAAFVVGTVHTVSGLAGGVMLSIILTPLLGVTRVIPVLSVALLIGATSRLWVFRHLVDWKIYRSVMITGIPGLVIGAGIYSLLSPEAVAGVLGVFLIATIIARRTFEQTRFQIGARAFSVVGLIFGLVSGATVGGGMLLVPFLFGAGLTGERFVAMIGAVGFTLNGVKVLTFSSLDVLDLETIVIGCVTGLFVVPGTYLGYWIVKKTPIRIHTAFVESIVVAGALFFLWFAFGSYFTTPG